MSLAQASQEFSLLYLVLLHNSYRCSPKGKIGRTQGKLLLGLVEAGLVPAAS